MSTGKDPERLLTEALRAQAAQTSPPVTPRDDEDTVEARPVDAVTENVDVPARPSDGVFSGYDYGLISGSDLGRRLRAQAAEQTTPTGSDEPTARVEPEPKLNAGVILLLALVLGLAAGSVIGLLTLL
ncbi:hypothetical protein EV193_105453 [Herbihabitans rhizosphaerae]|uniref:Uncharacterized protein n=1 Tax=Herbihabitans rhizosphaerae TaxID=1872711 RepID=A0A4V2ESK5_9PSEU|nr:hypothetical protein [Herbihabitans rhizosphaerae]RZS37893.1 hypothetical protein EV193_105453 [Herbihabitans rhizosphaerae]